ncbi:hypothetical protein [Streptomyces sp. NPDC001056]
MNAKRPPNHQRAASGQRTPGPRAEHAVPLSGRLFAVPAYGFVLGVHAMSHNGGRRHNGPGADRAGT